MNESRETLFDVLEPPPGGLAGLRTRMERDRRRRAKMRRAQVVAGAALIVGLAGWIAFGPRGMDRPLPPEFDLARMSTGQLPFPDEALTIPPDKRDEIAARRVMLSTDEVVFYLIAALDPDERSGP